jgi:hypothetical protein
MRSWWPRLKYDFGRCDRGPIMSTRQLLKPRIKQNLHSTQSQGNRVFSLRDAAPSYGVLDFIRIIVSLSVCNLLCLEQSMLNDHHHYET